MKDDIYKTPESKYDIEFDKRGKRSITLWLCCVYLFVLSSLRAIGIYWAISRNIRGFEVYPAWILIAIFSPFAFKIIAAISLFFLKKFSLFLLVIGSALGFVYNFAPPYTWKSGHFYIMARLLDTSLINYIDWIILLLIIYYVIRLYKKGELQ